MHLRRSDLREEGGTAETEPGGDQDRGLRSQLPGQLFAEAAFAVFGGPEPGELRAEFIDDGEHSSGGAGVLPEGRGDNDRHAEEQGD